MEVLEVVDDDVELLLDVPVHGMAATVAATIRQSSFSPASTIIGTWSIDDARDYVAQLPDAKVLTAHRVGASWTRSHFDELKSIGIAGVEIWADENLPPDYVTAAHDAGLLVYAYTVNEAVAMQHLLGVGVDGIETDVPAVLRRLIDAQAATVGVDR